MEFTPASNRLIDVLHAATDLLTRFEIEAPQINAERLLAHTLKSEQTQLYLNPDSELSGEQISRLSKLLEQRSKREPLQYVLGETEFMSLPFKVTPAVLIPRPETEVLVEVVVEHCKSAFISAGRVSILDLGAGSGCISVSLLEMLPNAEAFAVDISAEALTLARENAIRNGVESRIMFANLNFFSTDMSKQLPGRFDVLVSNPPYVSDTDYRRLAPEIKNYEPAIALRAGVDGFEAYRQICALAPDLLNENGFLALEIGMGQGPVVKKLLADEGFAHVQGHADYNGIERVITCEKTNQIV